MEIPGNQAKASRREDLLSSAHPFLSQPVEIDQTPMQTQLEDELDSALAAVHNQWPFTIDDAAVTSQQANMLQEFMDLDKMNDSEIHNFLSTPELRSFLFESEPSSVLPSGMPSKGMISATHVSNSSSCPSTA